MPSLVSRTLLAGSAALGLAVLAASAWSGCATSDAANEDPFSPDGASDASAFDDTRLQVVDVRDDSGSTVALCGDEQLCDPDIAAICTPLSPDAGDDTAPADAAADSSAGSTAACRVVRRENRSIAACAAAGKVAESEFCASDDECAPGLACVGALGRCLRYCCKAWSAPGSSNADAGSATHYCTPRTLTARPAEKVPVWVKLDNCTLLDDALQCLEGTTCTVVTNDGRTTCVQAGTGRDYASCTEQACDRGYVCLGTSERLCRKLCRESEGAAACPGGGYCQSVPTIPDGYGICTGGDAAAP